MQPLFLSTALIAGFQCPNINETDNLVIVSNKTVYRFNEKVAFKCLQGYELSGEAELTCGLTKNTKNIVEWKGQFPQCRGKRNLFR